jgi:nucleoside-diphosphate-sugar epimerase
VALNIDLPRGERVLVTGATGFTGSVLTRKLVYLGCQVVAISRSSSHRGDLSDLPIEWIEGDVFDPKVVDKAVNGVNYIFHLAAAYREAKVSSETYSRVHVESTKLLAQGVVRSERFKRFIHVSTVGVHGHIDEPPADEGYRFNPGDIYQITKADAERWITEYARGTGLPLTVIRPAAIYGAGDRRLLKLFKMAKLPLCPLFGGGKGLYHLIHVQDLTDIMISAAVNPQAVGEAYIAGDPNPIKLRELLKLIANELGNGRIGFILLPVWPLFLVAGMCELLCKPFGLEPILYRRRVAFFTKDRAFNTLKVREHLGFSYSYSAETGLRETARWYRENGWI